MSGSKKFLTVIASLVIVVIFFALFSISSGKNDYQPPQESYVDVEAILSSLSDYASSTTAPDIPTLPPTLPESTPQTDTPTQTMPPQTDAVTDTPAQTTDISSMSRADILSVLASAIDLTKAYTGSVTVHHSESFTANVTKCTGGDLVAGIANRVVASVLSPSDETLTFNGGKAVNSEGESVVILLPQSGKFSLTADQVSSADIRKEGENTVISVTLNPESVGVNQVPPINASSIGFLDVGSLDISFLQITKADIDYTGSTIQAVIAPSGYIKSAIYTIPLHVDGAGNAGFIRGSAVFDGAETETWEFNW